MKQALRKALALIAAAMFSCGLLAGSAWAAESVTVSVGGAEVDPGQEVTLPVSIAENPGIASFGFEVLLPEGAALVSIEKGDVLSSGDFKNNVDELRMTWYADDNVSANGTIANITIKAPTTPGEYTVGIDHIGGVAANFANQDFEPVPVTLESGILTVKGSSPEPSKVDVADCDVVLAKKSFTYDGKAKKPAVTVKNGDDVLVLDEDYEVTYASNIGVGTGKVIVSGLGTYEGTTTLNFTIAKAANPFAIAKAARAVKLKIVKKKAQVIAGPVVKKKAQGTVAYSIKSVAKAKFKKYFTVAKKTGKITVKKGCPKGTYKVTVKAIAAGNKNYKKSTAKSAVVTIKVK